MPFPLKLSDDGLAEIESVAAARWSIPSDKELARRHRVSISRIQQLMAAVRDRLKLNKPVGSTGNLHVLSVSDESTT